LIVDPARLESSAFVQKNYLLAEIIAYLELPEQRSSTGCWSNLGPSRHTCVSAWPVEGKAAFFTKPAKIVAILISVTPRKMFAE